MEHKQLDLMLQYIRTELSKKEKQLEVLISEVGKLKNEAKTLEDARVLLTTHNKATAYPHEQKMQNETAVSLQGEIIKCLRSSGKWGLTVAEITDALKTFGYPNSDSKSFYPNVFTTIQRLRVRNVVTDFATDDNKRKYKLVE
jgi:hypothetical protein